MSIRPLTHAAPHARPRRAEPPQSRVDRNRVARQADRPFLDPSAPSRWSRWSRLSRAGPEGAAGGAREVIESAEARHASGAFLPLHLSGVSSWVASRDHRDFQDDRDGPVAQAAPESIRPLAHATPLVDATPPPGGRSLRDRQRVAVVGPPQSRVDGNRVAREPPDHFSTRLRRPGGLGGPGCLVLALKAQRGVPEEDRLRHPGAGRGLRDRPQGQPAHHARRGLAPLRGRPSGESVRLQEPHDARNQGRVTASLVVHYSLFTIHSGTTPTFQVASS